MHHFTIAATVGEKGGINADASERIRQHIAALPPGVEIAVSIRHTGDAAHLVEQLAAWYNALTDAEMNDPAFLDRLLVKSDELSFYLMRLSQDVGEYYRRKNATELQRKNAYNQAMHSARKSAGDGKFVVSAAEIEVLAQIADYLNAESLADAEYRAAYLFFEAANSVKDRMSQRISNLKSYRDTVLRGANPNFPEK